MVVTTSLAGFLTKAFSAFTRIDRPSMTWTSVSIAIFALLTCAYIAPSPASAVAGINQQINFQGRLLNAQGATVPDGYYNIQFKIYQDGDGQTVGNTTGSPAGTLKWTESHLNSNSQGVMVKNGFMSVQLGSVNAFGSQVDWNQDTIWLSMNIGNTNVSCTPFSSCSPDGEMVPMKRMSATPYSLNSGLLNGLASSNFVQLAQGVQTDASAGPSSIFINKTNTGNLLQLQSSGTDAFTVNNAGDLTFGNATNHTLSVTTAAAATAGKSLTVSAGDGGSGSGSVGGDLVLQGGAAGGTNANGGNVTLNAGAKTGTGINGTISIGTSNTSGITLGVSTVLAADQSLTLTGGATRPVSPVNGMLFYDTATDQLLVYSDATSKWKADGSEAVLVAASNSSDADKAAADYIADGTGDQTEINSALTSASASGARKTGKVYLFAGTYTIGASISVPNNVTLSGAGNGTIIKLANNINADIKAIVNTDTTTGAGVNIVNMTLDGNKANNSAGLQSGVYLDRVGDAATNRSGGKVTNVETNNFRTYGIVAQNSYNTAITNNTANSNDLAGIVMSTSSYGTVTSNVTNNNASYGIWFFATNTTPATGNTAYGNGAIGIYVQSGGYNTVASNATAAGTQYGIYLNNTTYNTVTGNTASLNALGGLYILNGSFNILSANTLVSNGGNTTNNAIQLNGADSNTISGNNITDGTGTTNCSTSCYAINIGNSTSDTNYVNANVLGNGTIRDLGTGTIYGGQVDASANYLVQPAGTIELMKNTNVTGNLAATGDGSFTGGDVTIATTTATDDRFVLNVTSGGAARFDGTLKVADLTANQTWTLPNETGVICTTGSVCSGYAAASASGSYVQFAPAAAQTDATNNNSIYINKTSGTGNIIALQKSGVDVFTINNTGDANFSQNVTVAAGKSLILAGGNTASRPASPTEGMVYYDTETDQLLTYANGKWQADHSEAVLVAANDSSPAAKAAADYVADGTADQAEINSALTEATTATGNNLGSRKVYLFAGTYTTADTISIPNDTTLIGSGKGTLIQFGNLGGVSKNMITNTTTGGSGTGITIRDLKLDGNKATNSTDTFNGIYLDGAGSSSTNLAGATITNVVIQNFENHGIYTTNSANNTITSNTIQSNDDYGIYTNSATTGNHDIITNNTITSNTLNGIYLNATVRSIVSGNFIGSNGNYGIRIEAGSNNIVTDNVLRSNTGSGATSSIHVIGGGGTEAHLITGNNITDTAGTGYAINLADTAVDGVYLSNNIFSGTGASSINDASGGDTIYSGQSNGNSYLIQPVDDFSITGNAASSISTTAGDLTVQGGSGTVTLGTSTNLTASGALTVASAASTALTLTSNAATTWKTTSGNLTLDAGATLELGTVDATGLSLSKTGATTTVNGHLTVVTGQNLTVNGDVFTDLTGSGLTVSGSALTVDASSATGFYRNGGNSFGTGATLGTNDNNELALRTNGTTRATFSSTSNTLYVGNADGTGVAASPSSFTIQATSNSGTGAGGTLTIQSGGSGTSANGADLNLNSGTGGNNVNGQVVISTPTFKAYTGALQTCSGASTSLAIDQQSVDNFGTVNVASTSSASCTISVPDPTITTAGRVIYITADNASTSSFTLSINGGGAGNVVAMRANSSATLVWNGSKWAPAGASSSTTLQAAYDNTIQTPGGAELIVSKTSSTNGLTIRDSSTNPVNGAVLSVQSSSAANLLSINSNVTEYASNAGAESQGASASTFPSTTWSSYGTGASIARNTTSNNNTIATGQASVAVTTSGGSSANTGVQNQIVDSSGAALALLANNHYNVSFSVRLPDGASTFTDLNVRYQYDGTAGNTVTCTTGKVVAQNVWTKVNCSFTTPTSGITSANVIRIEQGSTASRTFYVDNLSVTIAADYSLATDGSVDAALGSNWNLVNGATVARSTTYGNNASSSVEVTTSTTTNQGVNNLLSIKPLQNTLYRVTVYLASTTNMSGAFDIRYSPDNGSTFVDCEDYNTSTISTSLTAFTKVTCYIPTGATTVTTPYVYFRKTDATARVFYVDTFSMTLAAPSTPNVQVGSGTNGGPTTLFTLDRGASAPIAGDNESLLGSMYYDTTLGKLQCYEADGWGACGSSPDNIITISPEYTNAVMHGTGVGTMISDLCSDFLNINDGSSSQPTICGANETYNFYNWTSPQASSQTYSIYVTYQLPNTFKSFTSGSTSLQGRVSSTSNASISYSIYKSTGSSMVQCGTNVSVASGAANTWETKVASGAADPSACGFAAGNSIVFKISMSANSNANAYIGNIGFTFSNN